MNPQQAQQALNAHGSFLKKRVLQEIYDNIPGVSVLDEEVGVNFGQARVSDIVCFQTTSLGNVLYVVECRTVDAGPEWLFLRHIAANYRELRVLSRGALIGEPVHVADTGHLVCSEGYEASVAKKGGARVARDPVSQAADELCGAYLGFIQWVKEKKIKAKFAFVPILLTTAPLKIAEFPWSEVDISSGLLRKKPKLHEAEWLVLKHSFPTPVQIAQDLRLEDQLLLSTQATAESLYVVQSGSLKSFLSPKRLEYFAALLGS